MTATFPSDSEFAEAIPAEIAAPSRKRSARDIMKEVGEMSRLMVEQEGLLTYAQAAIVLGVSPPRIAGLVRDRVLTRYVFFDRPYVSLKEVCDRSQQDLRAGRPKRGLVERYGLAVKVVAKNTAAQWAAEALSEGEKKKPSKKMKKS